MFVRLGYYFLLSVFLHGLIFYLSQSTHSSNFRLELRKADPIEVSRDPHSNKTRSPHFALDGRASQDRSEEVLEKPFMDNSVRRSEPEKTPKTGASNGVVDGALLGISKPHYPESSRLRGEEGKVLLKLFLDSNKALVKAEVLESGGYSALDRSALIQTEKDLPKSQFNTIAFEHQVQFNFFLSRSNPLK